MEVVGVWVHGCGCRLIEGRCFEMAGLGECQLPSRERPCFGTALVGRVARWEGWAGKEYGELAMLYIEPHLDSDADVHAGEDSMADAVGLYSCEGICMV